MALRPQPHGWGDRRFQVGHARQRITQHRNDVDFIGRHRRNFDRWIVLLQENGKDLCGHYLSDTVDQTGNSIKLKASLELRFRKMVAGLLN